MSSLNEQVKQILKISAYLQEAENVINNNSEDEEPLQLTNLEPFFNKLLQTAQSGVLTYGASSYRDIIKLIQLGLLTLGYSLPKHGVDGLFGPETLSAVKKFESNNGINNPGRDIAPETITALINVLKNKNISLEDLTSKIEVMKSGGGSYFTDLDLNTQEGYNKYAVISQKFINIHQPNPLKISGEMIAYGAKLAFNRHGKYVPPELALSQLLLEGGIGNNDLASRPIRTKNPFNVGNIDTGANVNYSNVQSSINKYFDLIASKYLGGVTNTTALLQNFQNKFGHRYASNKKYESNLTAIVMDANKIARQA